MKKSLLGRVFSLLLMGACTQGLVNEPVPDRQPEANNAFGAMANTGSQMQTNLFLAVGSVGPVPQFTVILMRS